MTETMPAIRSTRYAHAGGCACHPATGEVPGATVVGELLPRGEHVLAVR